MVTFIFAAVLLLLSQLPRRGKNHVQNCISSEKKRILKIGLYSYAKQKLNLVIRHCVEEIRKERKM